MQSKKATVINLIPQAQLRVRISLSLLRENGIIIIIMVGLSSVSWSRDHIRDALVDNGIGPSPRKQGAKRAKVKREGFCSLAGPVIRYVQERR